MPAREAPVCLTRSPPFGIESKQLVFYDVVDVSTTARSGVLSTIADSGVEARLPDAVTLSDFKLWISFVNGNYKDVNAVSFLDLCTVVKVADALDDQDIAQWSNLAAERLVFHATSEPSGIGPDSIDVALATLRDAAQRRIFSVAASAPSNLYRLMAFLPPHYHASVVAAAVTADKVLSLPFSRDSIPALMVLAAHPQSPSSVLTLHSQDPEADSDIDEDPGNINIAGHLVQALQHHTHLTEVRISSGKINAASTKLLIPAIARLKFLQYLHLGDKACPLPGVSFPLLKQALPSLPRLQCLSATLSGYPRGGLKRPRKSEAAPDPCCLAAALSPASALTSLQISIIDRSQRSRYRATIPLELPHLRQLSVTVGVQDWELPTAFINRLQADQLTSLELRHFQEFSHREHLPCSSVAGAQRFVARLAHFSQLCHLCIALPHDAESEDGGAKAEVMEMMRVSAPAVLASLTHLQQLSITAEAPVLCSTVPALAASLTAVTSLALHSVSVRRAARIDVPWSNMCTSLCQMNLKNLHVKVIDRYPSRLAGLSSLQTQTQLSALHISGWPCLQTAADCEGLAGMTSLRRLSLMNCFDNGEPTAAVRGLLALSALTALTAWSTCEEFDEALIEEVQERDVRAAWPALRELCIRMQQSQSCVVQLKKLVRWSVALPALKKLAVSLPPDWMGGDEEESEAVERCSDDGLEDEGSEALYNDAFHREKSYRRIAAEAGVELLGLSM